MAKRPRQRSDRSLRRDQERARAKVAQDRERLFLLELGGAPARPLDASSAAVIEAHAKSIPCPRCEGRQEVTEHSAVVHEGVRLREVQLTCRHCGTRRALWFRIVGTNLN